MKQRKGYVLSMWTGLLEGEDELPRFFRTPKAALKALQRYPSWGRFAVEVRECTIRPNGANGNPDYIIGAIVAHGE